MPIRFAATAQLIRPLLFAIQIVQFLLFLNPKFQASSLPLCLHRPVCVGPGWKPNCWSNTEIFSALKIEIFMEKNNDFNIAQNSVCFEAKIRKIGTLYPCIHQFYYIKVEFKEVFIAQIVS